MGITLQKLTDDRATCTVKHGEDTAQVVYRPSAYTPALVARFRAARKAEEPDSFTVDFVSSLVTEWDVLDDGGNRIAPTPEFVATLPMDFLADVITEISEDMSGKAEKETTEARA